MSSSNLFTHAEELNLKNLITIAKWTALIILVAVVFYIPNFGDHWHSIFRPAVFKLIQGQNPYDIELFFNPPWALIPIIPFALLPERIGNALFASISLFGLGYIAWRMGARKWILVAFMLMPWTLYSGINVNLDWLVAVGFLLPPRWGLFLILLKPQLGIGLAFFWLIQAFHEGGIRKVITTFVPVGLAFIGSILLYGNYFMKFITLTGFQKISWYLFVPVAIALLAASLRDKKAGLAIVAGPFLSPYTQPYSVPIAMLGVMENPHLLIPSLLGLWILSIDPIVYIMSAFK